MADLKAEFDKYANMAKTDTSVKADDNQKLRLYGLFKVATVGAMTDANKNKAGILDFTTKYKNEAWQKFSVLSKEEAMAEYIRFFGELSGKKSSMDLSAYTKGKSIQ